MFSFFWSFHLYGDIYVNYLAAKIDYKNEETERYNNSVAAYEASFQAFASYYRRNHMPKEKSTSLGGGKMRLPNS